ncbi:TIGR01777 family oxidoreductase [Sediminibacterium goheungense]|uniref:TIGR01777 family protein n=1 Tax=Sediminibacterium goheungense TaxID=1086393 RepID=A0A4R6IWB5_9BACT|nr:TIGR01777 family oxidoreductase [Sediminibacterium goheungense]TDO26972.1 hypothetical protein BC659_2287 [Sediminibacterium goheungense]
MKTVLITGGTGMVGRYLTQLLIQKGYRVNWLSRQQGETNVQGNRIQVFQWDIEKQIINEEAISSADYIIHLAGAGVAEKRWTKQRKQEILDSRTKSSALIVKAMKEIPNQVQAVVSASAIGWYGPDNTKNLKPFTEDMPVHPGFLGDTCKAWEDSIAPVHTLLQKRLVRLRIGIVLSNTGGAIAEFKKPLRMGMLPLFGSGKQIVSWIHIADLCHLFLYALENKEMQGVFNAVAPNPVSSRMLMAALGKSMGKSMLLPIPIPSFFLRLLLGEMSIEILKSATVSSKKSEAAGFRYEYAAIDKAVEHL